MTEAIIFGGNDNHQLEHLLADPGNEANFATALPKYGVVLLMEQTSEQELVDLNKELPTDTHLVKYRSLGGELLFDAVRAYKKSDIFDAYHDAKCTVLDITSGYGAIKPKLFVDSTKKGS